MNARQGLGARGEILARRHLEANGYVILDTNYRAARHEIDLVAEKSGVLVFVEVRTRRGSWLGAPEESITIGKRSNLVSAAYHYLEAHGAQHREWRIDVVAIEMDAGGRLRRVATIENAVEGPGLG